MRNPCHDRSASWPILQRLNVVDTHHSSCYLCLTASDQTVWECEMDRIDLLIRDLNDETWGVREKAIETLVRTGKPAVEPLIAALNDDAPAIRRGAAEILGKIKDGRATEPLIRAVENETGRVREKAAEALGMIGDSRAVGSLIQALEDDTWVVRETAIEALSRIGKPAVAPLVEALEHEDVGVRTETARALRELDWRPKDPSQKAAYLIARKDWDELVGLGRPAAGPLIKALKDRDPRVRKKAARTLGEIGDVAAVESLTESLQDTEAVVREAAQEALDKIKKTT